MHSNWLWSGRTAAAMKSAFARHRLILTTALFASIAIIPASAGDARVSLEKPNQIAALSSDTPPLSTQDGESPAWKTAADEAGGNGGGAGNGGGGVGNGGDAGGNGGEAGGNGGDAGGNGGEAGGNGGDAGGNGGNGDKGGNGNAANGRGSQPHSGAERYDPDHCGPQTGQSC